MHRIRQAVGSVLVAGAVAGGATAATSGANLTLVAYSTPRAAYAQLIPAFQGTPAARTSRSRSPTERRATRAVPSSTASADVVMFSLYPDLQRLVKPGIVAASWNKDRYHGMVTDSVVVLVRPARQPEAHQGLERPGQARRRRDHAEPVHLGRRPLERDGRLRRPAKAGKTPAQAEKYLVKLFKNVSVQDKSARESLQTFATGKGDVLIGYENEAISRRRTTSRSSTWSRTRRS